MVSFLWTVQIIPAFLLIVLIFLHSPKGDGLAGIGGMSHVFASQKSAEKGLNQLTTIIACIFAVCTFILGYLIK
jgi:preprotein translocase subunit SecG